MQAWRMRALLVAIIVLLPFEGEILYSSWPYLPWIGRAFAGLFIVCCACVAVRLVAFTYLDIKIKAAQHRKEVLNSHLIDASGVVVLAQTDGTLAHLSAEHEASKRPLMLPPPQNVDHRSTPETVLELHSHGIGFKSIAESTGWTEYQVRKLCNAHDGKI